MTTNKLPINIEAILVELTIKNVSRLFAMWCGRQMKGEKMNWYNFPKFASRHMVDTILVNVDINEKQEDNAKMLVYRWAEEWVTELVDQL